MILHIDFETRSKINLLKTGVYRYAEDDSTDIWCMAFAFDDGKPDLWVPGAFLTDNLNSPYALLCMHVKRGGILKAHNASFERIIWEYILGPRYGFPVPAMEQWHCSAAEAAAMGLPRNLGKLAEVLGVESQKDAAGHRLMMQMCKPRKPTKTDPREWWDDRDRKNRLYEYCRQDVRTEQAVSTRLRPLSDAERAVYLLDQRINDRGVPIDLTLVRAAERVVEKAVQAANAELEEIANIPAVTAVAQLTEFTGLADLRRATVEEALRDDNLDPIARRALKLRLETARTSTAKLAAMRGAACADGRVRGSLLYHGALTGRWSGKIVQFHNVPRGEVKCASTCESVRFNVSTCDCGGVERFIPAVLEGKIEGIPPLVLVSSLLRSMVKARQGHRLIAGDYAQIEARVLAWLAGQTDLVEAFRSDEPIYEAMAASIFGVPVDEVTGDQRFVGKTAVLGCGYGMGAKKYGETNGLAEELAALAVETYRSKNYCIPLLWDTLNRAAYRAVVNPGSVHSAGRGASVRYTMRGQYLWCQLPSRRFLAYSLPRIENRETPWGEVRPSVTVCGVDSMTKKWRRYALYGGILAENVVQAIARDLLAAAMLRLEAAGYPTIMSVHDEAVAEVPEDFGSVAEFERLMGDVPSWAEGLPVKVEAWESARYRK